MNQQKGFLARRRFLEIMGVAGGVVALRSVWSAAPALADETSKKLLLFVHFSGGWDQIAALVEPHWQDLTIVRGVMMDTLTHEVGRRYFITGKFPRGLAANGSALPTM